MDVRLLPDAAATLELLAGPLRAAGAEAELALGLLHRLLGEPDAWGDAHFAAALEGDEPVALAMMTGRHPVLVVGFVDAAAIDFVALAQVLHDAGIRPGGVNGANRCSDPFAAAWSQLPGASTTPDRELRAFELRTVVPPRPTGGSMREADAADEPLLLRWTTAFGVDIDEPVGEVEGERLVRRLTAGGDLVVWMLDGEPVSMAAVNRRTPWSSCVALVYTPPGLRGRGFASELVAALSQRELDRGQTWVSLFTDVDNPTSNHIYAEIGYEPRADFRKHDITWAEQHVP